MITLVDFKKDSVVRLVPLHNTQLEKNNLFVNKKYLKIQLDWLSSFLVCMHWMKIYFNAGNGDGTKEDYNRGRPFRCKLLPAPCHQVNLLYPVT